MLKVNFDLSKYVDTTKAVPGNKSTSRKRRGVGEALGIGDPTRISSLPETVDETFLELYEDNLDELMTRYINNGDLPLSQAVRYKIFIFDTIFGNHDHLGLYQYITSKTGGMYSHDREIVEVAEGFLMRGWKIVRDEESGRWWLLNDSLVRVMDVTGSTSFSREAGSQAFNPGTAHLFLSDDVASKVAALASRAGMDADTLVSMGQLDLLLSETANQELAGYLMNYNALRSLLKKSGKYSRNTDSLPTLSELYDDGYRLGSQIFYPALNRVVMEGGGKNILLTPVSSDLNENIGLNISILSVLASRVRESVYRHPVVPQTLQEIGEMGQVIAFQTEFWETDATRNSPIQLIDIMGRLDSAFRSKNISRRQYSDAKQAFAEMVLTEVVLLGNHNFTTASFGFDSVGGIFFVYATDQLFASGEGEGREFPDLTGEWQRFFKLAVGSGITPELVYGNIEELASLTSQRYRTALKNLKLPIGDYGELVFGPAEKYVQERAVRILDAIR